MRRILAQHLRPRGECSHNRDVISCVSSSSNCGEERMKRRDFVAGVLLAATIPHAQAQQHSKVYRLAFAAPSTPVNEMTEASGHPIYPPLFEELKRLGYVEGRNLTVERYS